MFLLSFVVNSFLCLSRIYLGELSFITVLFMNRLLVHFQILVTIVTEYVFLTAQVVPVKSFFCSLC